MDDYSYLQGNVETPNYVESPVENWKDCMHTMNSLVFRHHPKLDLKPVELVNPHAAHKLCLNI